MSWSELERLVEQAESDAALRRALTHCRSRAELVLAGRRLGFGIDAAQLGLHVMQDWQQRPFQRRVGGADFGDALVPRHAFRRAACQPI